MNDTPIIVRLAGDAHQAIRQINHETRGWAIPAPVLYDTLGPLKQLGPALAQALTQLADALVDSLAEYDVYNDDGTNPTTTIACCGEFLTAAADHAKRLGHLLETAQTAIANQGYRVDD